MPDLIKGLADVQKGSRKIGLILQHAVNLRYNSVYLFRSTVLRPEAELVVWDKFIGI